jgi:hypothetical protein
LGIPASLLIIDGEVDICLIDERQGRKAVKNGSAVNWFRVMSDRQPPVTVHVDAGVSHGFFQRTDVAMISGQLGRIRIGKDAGGRDVFDIRQAWGCSLKQFNKGAPPDVFMPSVPGAMPVWAGEKVAARAG